MNSDSAKNGFKTFILTLSISLIVFSVVYYLVTNGSSEAETAPYRASNAAPAEKVVPVVAGDSVVAEIETAASGTEDSVFGEIAQAPLSPSITGSGVVLAGATSSPTTQTTSSVPETGVVGITAGLLVSLIFFVTGMYYVHSNPRKAALSGFEKKVLKDN